MPAHFSLNRQYGMYQLIGRQLWTGSVQQILSEDRRRSQLPGKRSLYSLERDLVAMERCGTLTGTVCRPGCNSSTRRYRMGRRIHLQALAPAYLDHGRRRCAARMGTYLQRSEHLQPYPFADRRRYHQCGRRYQGCIDSRTEGVACLLLLHPDRPLWKCASGNRLQG